MLEGSCHCGVVQWQFRGTPESATACNCTVCRRYGVLWAYDFEGEGIHVSVPTRAYVRGKAIEFHFCPTCGCVAYWRGQEKDATGRRRIAVNLRLTEPEPVARLPIDHFDGLVSFEDLPRDGRCVADYWFRAGIRCLRPRVRQRKPNMTGNVVRLRRAGSDEAAPKAIE